MLRPDAAPLCSLIVATYDDGGDLAPCLRTLADTLTTCGDGVHFEVIVVDQNRRDPDSGDRVAEAIADVAGELSVTHLRVAWVGASRARNHGAAVAAGTWLGFPDDDCTFPVGFADALVDTLRGTEATVVSGRTTDHDGVPNLRRWPDRPREYHRATMFNCAIEAVTFYRRTDFDAAGGFDERFGPGARYPAAEGFELLTRLTPGARWTGYFDPRIVLLHPTASRADLDRVHRYAIGRGAAAARHALSPLALITAAQGLRSLLSGLLRRPTRPPKTQPRTHRAYVWGLLRGALTYAGDRLLTVGGRR